jgi:hypothetical protein
MDDITVFNLRVVNKGALKATMSIRLGNGLTTHVQGARPNQN